MKFRIPIALVGLLALPWPAAAQLKLLSLLADHMVLQQGKPLTIWGWNTPGNLVNILLRPGDYKTITNAKGEWQCELPSTHEGEGCRRYGHRFKGTTQTIHDTDRRSMGVQRAKQYGMAHEPAAGGYENRTGKLPQQRDTIPHRKKNSDKGTKNRRGVAERLAFDRQQYAGDCSSVAYYFARKLYERLKVPIGLLVTSWGGTPGTGLGGYCQHPFFPNYYATYRKDILPARFSIPPGNRFGKTTNCSKREEAATSIAMRGIHQ